MKYVGNAAIILVSLCLAVLIGTDSVGIGVYIILVAMDYMLILLLNADFRKAVRKFFLKKGSFGQGSKYYGEIHLETIKEDIEKIEPIAFEHFIGDLFSALGYKTKVIGSDKDFGGDVIAKKGKDTTIIQVKHRNSSDWSVSNDAVQQAVAAMSVYKANQSMVVTNGEFTDHAYQQAQYCHTIMIDGKQLYNLVRQAISNHEKNNKNTDTTLVASQVEGKSTKGSHEENLEEWLEMNEITKADCLNEQLENVLADTIPEVTLETLLEEKSLLESEQTSDKVANSDEDK